MRTLRGPERGHVVPLEERKRKSRGELRAELYLIIHWQQGAQRSLRKTTLLLNDCGLKVSVSTMRRDSQRYDWERRIQELDQRVLAEARSQLDLNLVAELTRRQQMARALTGISARGLQEFASDPKRMNSMRLAELVRAADVAMRLERAEFEAREQFVESVRSIVGGVLPAVNDAFVETRDIEDVTERTRLFSILGDRYVLRALKHHGLAFAGASDE